MGSVLAAALRKQAMPHKTAQDQGNQLARKAHDLKLTHDFQHTGLQPQEQISLHLRPRVRRTDRSGFGLDGQLMPLPRS